jgi:hypothetical protein
MDRQRFGRPSSPEAAGTIVALSSRVNPPATQGELIVPQFVGVEVSHASLTSHGVYKTATVPTLHQEIARDAPGYHQRDTLAIYRMSLFLKAFMRRHCGIAVFGFAMLVGVSSPARAVSILDIQGLENLELAESPYARSLNGAVDGAATDSANLFDSTSLSVIGTSGVGNFADGLSQGTMGSFLEGSPFIDVAGSETGSGFLESTMLAGNVGSCGSEPGSVLECWHSASLALPGATVMAGGPGDADGQRPSTEPNSPDRLSEDADAPRQASAPNPTPFILLTSGLAAAGFAGWRTFLKGRRRRARKVRRF